MIAIASRISKVEAAMSKKSFDNVRPWWEFKDWERHLNIIDIYGQLMGKELLNEAGEKIARQVHLSFISDLPCYNRKTKGEAPPEWTEEKKRKYLIEFVKECSQNEVLKPYIKSFDTLEADLLQCYKEKGEINNENEI